MVSIHFSPQRAIVIDRTFYSACSFVLVVFLSAAWGMQAEYEQLSVEMNERAILLHRSEEGPIQMVKRWKSDDGFPVSQLCVRLDK